jgi:hypothetical protein
MAVFFALLLLRLYILDLMTIWMINHYIFNPEGVTLLLTLKG